jgi:hypothetical protein
MFLVSYSTNIHNAIEKELGLDSDSESEPELDPEPELESEGDPESESEPESDPDDLVYVQPCDLTMELRKRKTI